jgi:lysophospholipase L1-like esterase
MKTSSCLLVAALLFPFAHVRAAEPSATAPAAAPAASPLAIPATDAGLPGDGPIRRYEWFQKLWLERRTNWASRVTQDQGALVFLGDSITQGWTDTIGGLFPGVKVANRGISGDTTRGVLIRLKEDVLSLNPKGVVLLIGTNDLEEQAEPATVAANLWLIIAELKKHNASMPVILCNVFPSSATKKRPASKIRAVNQLYLSGLANEPQVTVVDTYALFANTLGDANPDEFPDLLHPNGAGYARWERALRPALELNGLVPSWPDDFTPEPGFTSLFNGRDFTGWTNAETPALAGKTETSDGRFVVRNGRLITTPARVVRAFRRVQTERVFAKDFTLKLEFRASPNADSGIYVRGPQLQCRDYLIAGPYMALKHYRPLDWNEIVITVKGGLAHCTCNGEVLIDAMPIPASGPIGLESDHGQMEYRRIRYREAP